MRQADPLVDYIAGVPLVASVLFYSLAILLGHLSRAVVRAHAPLTWQPYLLDAVSTFQTMSCSLENTHIKEFYGEGAYFCVLCVLSVYTSVTVAYQASTNPCAHVHSCVRGRMAATEVIARSSCQLLAGLLSFPFARQFWRLGLHLGHRGRYSQLHCVADLSLPPGHGAIVEFSATFVDAVMFAAVITSYSRLEGVVKCCVSSYMVVLGVHLTGMYMNPINATNQTFGCHGISIPAHILVYWVAPLSATALFAGIQRHLENRRLTKGNGYSNRSHGNSDVEINGNVKSALKKKSE